VGSLFKREIIKCVEGFHSYVQKHPEARARFVIIGTAENELKEINAYIGEHDLKNKVHTLGYIPQTRLSYFFNHSHCGISFMPLTNSYRLQPNTKTYEYLVNGIPVIAVAALDNIQLINSSKVPCGLIINDTRDEVEGAIGQMLNNRHLYIKEDIAKEFKRFVWDNLFDVYLGDALMLPKTTASA
jgi:glycosyltransferase involved in cell wall biosynthesis